ncbi:MAG: hypothetical protein QOH74_1628, partial [Gaiellales bacterium]|nr:hypothetical protein [Gaiellales bacterium]
MSEALPAIDPTAPVTATGPTDKQVARRQTIRLLMRQPEFIIGATVLVFWV